MGNYAGLVVNGTPLSNESAGYSVTNIGDFNGDGFDDIAFGAPTSPQLLPSNYGNPYPGDVGAVYVVFGTDQGFDTELDLDALDGTDGFKINPDLDLAVRGFQSEVGGYVNGSSFGFDVQGLGDVNGDGAEDFAIAQSFSEQDYFSYYNGGVGASGVAYVIFGTTSTLSAEEDVTDLADFRIDVAGEVTGLVRVGDVNGDGFADVGLNTVESAPYATGGFDYSVLYDDNDNGVYDPGEFQTSGTRDIYEHPTSGIVIFGTDQARVSDTPIAGGGATPTNTIVNAENLDGSDGFEIATGSKQQAVGFNFGFIGNYFGNQDYSGGTLTGIADFNGDGFDDLLVDEIGGAGFYGQYDAIVDSTGYATWTPNPPYGGEALFGQQIVFGQDTSIDPFPAVLTNPTDVDYNINTIVAAERTFASLGDVSGSDGFDDIGYGAFISAYSGTPSNFTSPLVTTNTSGALQKASF